MTLRCEYEDLWTRIEPLVARVARPSRYLDHEYGAVHHPSAGYRAVLIYPDTYELGQANQGLAILYRCLNALPDVSCERAYVPWEDMSILMREEGVPLCSLEGCAPLSSFDLVGITLPHELAYSNVLEVLDLAGIPLRSSDRDEGDPFVIAGGPCAYNPEPLAPFFDLVNLGEGEEMLCEVAEEHRRCRDGGLSRHATLLRLADIPGIYVPSFYAPVTGDSGGIVPDCSAGNGNDGGDGALTCRLAPYGTAVQPIVEGIPAVVVKRVLRDFGASPVGTAPIVPYAEVAHDRLTIEVLRGCARGCRFCQAGMMYRPVRERTSDQVVSATLEGLACTGYDEVSLTSLSTTDHSGLPDILRRLNRRLEDTGVGISLPSQRVDAFGVEMARLVAGDKKGGLTLAPEAGTQRLRDIINKGVTEEDLMRAVTSAFSAGWRHLKLYFMLGLPYETDEDVRGIGELVARVAAAVRTVVPPAHHNAIRIGVSCAVFIPKPDTPFQWCGQLPLAEVRRRQQVLRASMPRKGVTLSWHDADSSCLEGAMARGGREMAAVVEAAWRDGARFDAWTEYFSFSRWEKAAEKVGIDLVGEASRTFDPEGPLPWSHLSAGVSQRFLHLEWERAGEGVITSDCTFGACSGCGVCQELDVKNVIEKEVRHG